MADKNKTEENFTSILLTILEFTKASLFVNKIEAGIP